MISLSQVHSRLNQKLSGSELQVRIKIPERLEPVTPHLLSQGAQDQVYLLLRLGLTELMSSQKERLPLILDDPLVNYDEARLAETLTFLKDLAGKSQIVLFTTHKPIRDWALAYQGQVVEL